MTLPKALPNDLIDSLLSNYKKPEDLIGENGRLKQLTKALVERALQAEMAEHLGRDKHEPVTVKAASSHNSSLNTKSDGQALMTRSSHCTHVA